MEMKTYHHRRSLFWPLILITIGVVFLLNSLGIIQGDGWTLFTRLWPLLFLIGGLDHIYQNRGWVWGIFSLGLGTVFLLANFGYLPWNGLSVLLRLWPLLLVALGLDLVFRERSALTTVIGVLLALLIVGGITWYAVTYTGMAAGQTETIRQELNGAEQANLRIGNPIGRLEVRGGAEQNLLIEGRASTVREQNLDQSYNVSGGVGSYSLSSSGIVFLPWAGGFTQPLWSLEVNDSIPLTLSTNTGAGDLSMDLRGLDLERLDVTVAVGQVEITLPANDSFSGAVSNPIGNTTIYVPRGALVEFRISTAISARDVAADFRVEGDRIYSPGANADNARVQLSLEQPIGRLGLRLVP